MLEHPLFQFVAGVMVLLLVAAWWFPNVKWLAPFRAPQVARPRPSSSSRTELPPAFARQTSATAVTEPVMAARLAARQSAFRRVSRMYAGVSIIATGFIILFGHYVMARMTGTNPDAEPGLTVARFFAAACVVAGVGVLFVRSR